jgi:hypothetical protein
LGTIAANGEVSDDDGDYEGGDYNSGPFGNMKCMINVANHFLSAVSLAAAFFFH